jgi:hypothetical protein
MKKTFFITSIILGGGLAFYWNFLSNVFYDSSIENTQQIASVAVAMPIKEIVQIPDFVVVTFAGDAMMDRGVKSSVNKNLNGDYKELFENVEIFKSDDISFLKMTT